MFGLELNKVTSKVSKDLGKITNVFGGGGNNKEEDDVVEDSKDEKPKEEAEESESGDPSSVDDNEGDTEATTIAAVAEEEVKDEAPKTLKKKVSKQTTDDDEDGEADKPKSLKKKEEASPKKIKKKSVKKQSVAKKADDAAKPEDDYDDDGNLKEEEEDVMKLLEGMDIPDFNMSMDLDDDWKGEDHLAESADPKVKQKHWESESIDWKERLTRDEVFSKHYHPSREETLELNGMADHLGLAPSTGLFGMGKRMSMQIGMGAQVTEDMHTLFYGGSSILLKHGPVQWEGKACALLLLTDGFVLTYSNINAKTFLENRYETCQLWTSVDFCETVNPMTFCIQLHTNGERYEFTAVEEEGDDVGTWVNALERVLIHHAMHRATQLTETLGWQYQRSRRPAFTAAVTGNLEVLGEQEPPATINRLDSYNHYAPLHYAVLQETPNANVIQALLQAGADPNLADADGRSAMYYAERNKLDDILTILKESGGRNSKLAEMEERGELFGGIAAANQNTEQRRELAKVVKENEQTIKDEKAAEAAAKAEGAQSEMGKAMSALVERGEKIERLDQKTQDLESEAQNYAGLAARLKEEVKNKKWYQL